MMADRASTCLAEGGQTAPQTGAGIMQCNSGGAGGRRGTIVPEMRLEHDFHMITPHTLRLLPPRPCLLLTVVVRRAARGCVL